MSEIHVYVKTPLKRNGKVIPPSDKAIALPADEARSLIEVGAVVARDLAAPATSQPREEGHDPEGAAPGATGERNEKGGGSDDSRDPGAQSGDEGPLNVNSASAAELAAVKGVGEEIANAIVAKREQDGPFESVDALTVIPGIGPATAKKLAAHLTV